MRITHIIVFCAALIGPAAYSQSLATSAAERQFKRVDAELNRTYRQVMGNISDSSVRRSFMLVQRQWLSYRDAEAAFRAHLSSKGGSAYTYDYLNVMSDLSTERLLRLRRLQRAL